MELFNLFSTIRDKDFTKVSKTADGLKQYVGALLDKTKSLKKNNKY